MNYKHDDLPLSNMVIFHFATYITREYIDKMLVDSRYIHYTITI